MVGAKRIAGMDASQDQRQFGKHIQRLRKVRRMTQEDLAVRSGVAPDTIRRLEHGGFSPSLKTLRKVCAGLELSLSALFGSFELPCTDPTLHDFVSLLQGRSPQTIRLAVRVVGELLVHLDEQFWAGAKMPRRHTRPKVET